MREAYSHEVSSAGFWPGGGGADPAAFYSYAYPVPDGFKTSAVRPEAAFFSESLGEFLLPYDAVRAAPDPDEALLAFLQGTYEAAAGAEGSSTPARQPRTAIGLIAATTAAGWREPRRRSTNPSVSTRSYILSHSFTN